MSKTQKLNAPSCFVLKTPDFGLWHRTEFAKDFWLMQQAIMHCNKPLMPVANSSFVGRH
jgi:hypothetical protein